MSGQTVLVLGSSAGIGLAAARHARAKGPDVTARNAEPLRRAAADVSARQSAAFDVHDRELLRAFFAILLGAVTQVMASGPRMSDGARELATA